MKILFLLLILSLPTFAQDPFWMMYEKPTIAEKKAIWSVLTPEEQVSARRANLAWGAGVLNLSPEQTEYLSRFSNALPTMTKRQRDAFRNEAIELFPTGGDLLFGSIGPYKPCSMWLEKLPRVLDSLGNCPCSVGSSFNMQCDGECTAANNRCTATGSGCGFAWMYSCNGMCQAG